MNERFNFYDVYGYLIPGALLLVLFWLPFGLLLGEWPPAHWASAVIAVPIAYIAGHILHSLVEEALPSKFPDKEQKGRYPSYVLLNPECGAQLPGEPLGNRVLGQLAWQVRTIFDIDLKQESVAAFYHCRSYLIRKKAAAYFEQQHGMYALMRSAAGVFIFAAALYFGLGLSGLVPFRTERLLLLLFGLLIAVLFSFSVHCFASDKRHKAFMFKVLAGAIFLGGLGGCGSKVKDLGTLQSQWELLPATTNHALLEQNLRGETNAPAFRDKAQALNRLRLHDNFQNFAPVLFLLLGLACVLLAKICHLSFQTFACSFAATIFRDFNGLALRPPPSKDDIAMHAHDLFERDGKLFWPK